MTYAADALCGLSIPVESLLAYIDAKLAALDVVTANRRDDDRYPLEQVSVARLVLKGLRADIVAIQASANT